MKENIATVDYSTTQGMTARPPVTVEGDSLEQIRDYAACLVNGDTYTFVIHHKKGILKGFSETHAWNCGAKNCNCVFRAENPWKMGHKFTWFFLSSIVSFLMKSLPKIQITNKSLCVSLFGLSFFRDFSEFSSPIFSEMAEIVGRQFDKMMREDEFVYLVEKYHLN